jgi:uncharacterized SAM-binding protein YcdF (DUF218 family)
MLGILGIFNVLCAKSDTVMKNINNLMRGVGLLVTVVFFAVTLTSLPNYAARHFAIKSGIRPAGAIVVLGGGVWKGDMLDDASLRRTVFGIELYKRDLAPILVFSGPARSDGPTRSEAAIRAELALGMGVPRNAIVIDEKSNTTNEESIGISHLLTMRGIQSILLVTDSLHMRRADYLFKRVGMGVYPAPSDVFPVAATSSGDKLLLAFRVAQESAALIYYRLAGYI